MKKYFYSNFELEIPEQVYYAREDSELLANNIHAQKNSFVLDLGTGSGLQAIIALSQGARVLSADIDDNALGACKENVKKNKLEKNHSIRKSNLFSNISEKFDLILFNPPYVPTNEIRFLDTDGGKNGRKIIDEFLKELPKHLNKNGKCLLLQSNLNGIKKTEEILKKLKLKFKIIARKKMFFEELIVIEITNS